MTEDLTKLSGPELAEQIRAAWVVNEGTPPLTEALRRLEEDDRVAMRNLERSRDAWRALAELRERELTGRSNNREFVERLKRWEQWAEGVRCDVGTDDEAMDAIGDRCATLRRIEVILGVEDSEEEDAGYEALRKVVGERDELRAQCESWKRKALATQATLDRDDSTAQGMTTAELVAEVKRARETRGCLIGEVQQLKAIVANQRKELHSLNVERKATLTKLEDAQAELAQAKRDLQEQLDGNMAHRKEYGALEDETMGQWLARVHAELEALRGVDVDLGIASKRIAELEEQRELDAGSLRSAINNAQSRLAQVKRLESQLRDAQNAGADEWTADGEAVPEPATVVSTAALSAFEVAAANAADAMHVDADGLGFVKRAWLERHRGLEQPARAQIQAAWGAGPGTTPLSEPEELSERKYGAGCGPDYDGETLTEILGNPSDWSHVTYQLAVHIRETLATIKAVEALADKLDINGMRHSYNIARELREVLNGKR